MVALGRRNRGFQVSELGFRELTLTMASAMRSIKLIQCEWERHAALYF